MTKSSITRGAALSLLALAGACEGKMITSGDGRASTTSEARRLFESYVLPLLTQRCAGCHADDFLRPEPDVYTTVMTTPGLVSPEEASGALLTVGEHAGAELWTEDELGLLRQWLALEAAEKEDVEDPAGGQAVQPFEAGPVPLEDGLVRMPLDGLGLSGATASVRVSSELDAVYFSAFEIVSGASGLRLVHPRWVTWKGGTPTADPDDRFRDLEIVLGPYSRRTVREHTFMHVELPDGGEASVTFEVAEVSEP